MNFLKILIGMTNQESSGERRERFKAMSSDERKALIREKMKAEGLQEGSGIPGKKLSSYDQDEIWDLIEVTSCFPEMQKKTTVIKRKITNKKKSLITWIMLSIAIAGGIVVYYQRYPLPEIRRELSVEGIFSD